MFDANMAHQPRGARFFAEVNIVSYRLACFGIRRGDVVLCHMLNDGHDNPCVDVHVGGKIKTISAQSESLEYLLTYTGEIDGTGFIGDTLKQKAMDAI